MTQLGKAGMYLNFTYDELSPLLGVDPFNMYKAATRPTRKFLLWPKNVKNSAIKRR